MRYSLGLTLAGVGLVTIACGTSNQGTGSGNTPDASVLGAGGNALGGDGSTGNTGGTTSADGTASGSGETGRVVGMTAAINAVRQGVGTSPPIADVTWSSQIANVAQTYANQLASQGCTNLVPSQNRTYGENLAEFGGQAATPTDVVALWASKGKCWTPGPINAGDKCTCPNNGCGDYTQLVWRKTTEVGCGVATCPNSEVWVCDFAPPGNYVGQTAY
jgi:pathogenesis-related protein 1